MERTTGELARDAVLTAVDAGRIVLGRLFVGGAWGDTANQMEVPVRANITHFGRPTGLPENIELATE